MKQAIINGKVVLENSIEYVDIIFEDKIIALGKNLDTSDCHVIDAKGQYVSTGLIDIHIHGAEGADVMDGMSSSLDTISKSVLQNGVTRFLATTMTMSEEAILKSFDTVKAYMKTSYEGAQIIGIHVEGPFINKAKKGAQNEKYIIAPDYELIEQHVDEVKLMTVAPEIEGTIEFVKEVKQHDIHFSIGHSNATYEEAVKGFEGGIDSTTHMFNAMTGLHHRDPGVVGAVFKKKPYFEVIADKVHVHEALFDILGDCIGKEKMILVTDGMCACRMAPGTYNLGGQEVIVDDTSARLTSGALAGSILRMNQAVRNIKENTNYPLNEIINMASANPARMLDLIGLGKIEVGYQADFIIFDENIDIKETIVNGITRYRKDF